jgi:hypothetical protein
MAIEATLPALKSCHRSSAMGRHPVHFLNLRHSVWFAGRGNIRCEMRREMNRDLNRELFKGAIP